MAIVAVKSLQGVDYDVHTAHTHQQIPSKQGDD